MCGIAGLVGSFSADEMTTVSAALAHRGPDGDGVWRDMAAGVQMAHRRLAIIDTTTNAAQPMLGVDGRYVVLFNGEIYNFKSIVQDLQKCTRYVFNPQSDTAVLAPLFDRDGPAMLDRLEGMFAIAIWDTRTRRMFLARDHAGIKPLYIAETPRGLAFASELKALRAVVDDWTVDATAMADHLTFLWSPGERTMLRDVRKLRPGHALTISVEGSRPSTAVSRWYRPPQATIAQGQSPRYDATKTPRQLLALLDDVVAEQCTSDVPIGAFLSGGVDSSAVVASMVATGHRPAATYCIGFAGEGTSSEGFEEDLGYARQVARHLDVPLTELVVELDPLLMRLPTLPYILDEPAADPAPLFVLDIAAQAKADGIKVLLGGTGGDDIFSGYRRHQTARLRQALGPVPRQVIGHTVGLASSAVRTVGGTTGRRSPSIRRLSRLADLLRGDDERFLLEAFMTNSQSTAAELLADRDSRAHHRCDNALSEAVIESRGQDLLDRLLYLELFGFLPDHNLNYTDKAAMMAGVEGRVPLTDRRLFTFMAGVSPRAKLTGGLSGQSPKAFFKDALVDRLPRQVLSRSKTGFGAPIRIWLTSGPGKAMIEAALFDDGFTRTHFDRTALEIFWRQTCAGMVDGAYTALAIASMAWWWGAMRDSAPPQATRRPHA